MASSTNGTNGTGSWLTWGAPVKPFTSQASLPVRALARLTCFLPYVDKHESGELPPQRAATVAKAQAFMVPGRQQKTVKTLVNAAFTMMREAATEYDAGLTQPSTPVNAGKKRKGKAAEPAPRSDDNSLLFNQSVRHAAVKAFGTGGKDADKQMLQDLEALVSNFNAAHAAMGDKRLRELLLALMLTAIELNGGGGINSIIENFEDSDLRKVLRDSVARHELMSELSGNDRVASTLYKHGDEALQKSFEKVLETHTKSVHKVLRPLDKRDEPGKDIVTHLQKTYGKTGVAVLTYVMAQLAETKAGLVDTVRYDDDHSLVLALQEQEPLFANLMNDAIAKRKATIGRECFISRIQKPQQVSELVKIILEEGLTEQYTSRKKGKKTKTKTRTNTELLSAALKALVAQGEEQESQKTPAFKLLAKLEAAGYLAKKSKDKGYKVARDLPQDLEPLLKLLRGSGETVAFYDALCRVEGDNNLEALAQCVACQIRNVSTSDNMIKILRADFARKVEDLDGDEDRRTDVSSQASTRTEDSDSEMETESTAASGTAASGTAASGTAVSTQSQMTTEASGSDSDSDSEEEVKKTKGKKKMSKSEAKKKSDAKAKARKDESSDDSDSDSEDEEPAAKRSRKKTSTPKKQSEAKAKESSEEPSEDPSKEPSEESSVSHSTDADSSSSEEESTPKKMRVSSPAKRNATKKISRSPFRKAPKQALNAEDLRKKRAEEAKQKQTDDRQARADKRREQQDAAAKKTRNARR